MKLILIDVQERLVPAMANDGRELAYNVGRLLRASKLLGVSIIATEQNPTRLGPTLPELAPDPAWTIPKMSFDASGLVADRLAGNQRVAVCGCEAHICVMQTVIGLGRLGFDVQVVADAIGSRREGDRELALRRMEKAGAEVISTEMLIFERLESADHPNFREVMKIIK